MRFWGRFAVGYLQVQKFIEGACYGSVAASSALEQIGAPIRIFKEEGQAVWNDESVEERLKQFGARVKKQEMRRREVSQEPKELREKSSDYLESVDAEL